MLIFVWLLQNVRSMMPAIAMTPVRVLVDSRDSQPPPPPSSDSAITQPVTLVPSIAPSIMPMA